MEEWEDTRTEKQSESLLSLLKVLKLFHGDAIIHGHRDFSKKACPSFDASQEYKNI
jgi:N-acetylmuramoyl-L-alanine amidase